MALQKWQDKYRKLRIRQGMLTREIARREKTGGDTTLLKEQHRQISTEISKLIEDNA